MIKMIECGSGSAPEFVSSLHIGRWYGVSAVGGGNFVAAIADRNRRFRARWPERGLARGESKRHFHFGADAHRHSGSLVTISGMPWLRA